MVVFPSCGIVDARRNPVAVATQSAFDPGSAEYRNPVVWTQPRWGCAAIMLVHTCSTQGSRVGQPWAGRCNPVGVATEYDGSLLHSTQGSRVRQPWAGRCNPVGVATEYDGSFLHSTQGSRVR